MDTGSKEDVESSERGVLPDKTVKMSEAEDAGFTLDTTGQSSRFDYWRMGSGVIAGLALVGILTFSFTDLSSVLLPMDDRFFDVLIPITPDGTEPFALNELNHELYDKTLSVQGWMTNRSEVEVENVIAVITARDTTGRFPATLTVPVDPTLILPEGTGTFSMTVTLREKPNNYSIRFKLENGPFIPHKDQRRLQLGIQSPER